MIDALRTSASTSGPGDRVGRLGRLTRGGAAVAVAVMLLTAGCGDDDSPEAAFCDAAENLDSDVEALGEVDVAAEGTDALRSALGDIQSDLTELRTTGSEVFSEELTALDSALSGLEEALEAVSGDPTADDVTAIVAGVQETSQATQAALTKVEDTCN